MSCCAAAAGRVGAGPRPEAGRPWWRIVAALALAGNSMGIALAVNVSEVSPGERAALHAVLAAATLAVVALLGGPFVASLRAAVRRRTVTIEALFLCGMVGASGLSGWAILRREGDVYLEVVSLLLAVHALGQRLKTGQQEELRRQLKQLGRPPSSCLFVDDPEGAGARRRPASDIRPGTLLRLDPDVLMPVDGQVVAGHASFDVSTLTGEPWATAREAGAALPAGARCLDGTVVVRAHTTLADSSTAHLQAAIDAALARRSRIEAWAERGVAPFTAGVVGLAAATAAFWGRRVGGGAAFLHGMAVLLVACPCALGFATPVGMWTAVVRLARRGVVVRSTAAIERLARVSLVALDKTGTLTELTLAPAHLQMAQRSPHDRPALLAMVAAAQAACDHPIARAFAQLEPPPATAPRWAVAGPVGRAQAGCLTVPLRAGDARATLAFRALSPPAAARRPAAAPATDAAAAQACRAGAGPDPAPGGAPNVGPGDTAGGNCEAELARELEALLGQCTPEGWPIGITVDGRLAAVATLNEALTSAARRAMAALRALQLEAVVLSGDTSARAERAAAAGALRAHGDLTPLAKQQWVERAARGRGGVCVVGDGVNDAAAMAAAQVSVAIAEGAGLAAAAADFTLPQHGLDQLGPAIQISRQTLRAVRRNLAISGGFNLAGMSLAVLGLLHPVWAALWMVAASLTVTWRSARLLDGQLEPCGGSVGPALP